MIFTQYVWTEKGMYAGHNEETRMEGFPARFGYEPMEKVPEIVRSWLKAGYIRKVKEKLPFLQFCWTNKETTAAICMAKMFTENNIRWEIDPYGSLRAEIGTENEMVNVEYYHVDGNLYGITQKPKSTSKYFNLSSEELYEKLPSGYRREEALLMENNIHEKPFAKDMYHAIRKAAGYVKLGCERVEILECISNKYAVVCH